MSTNDLPEISIAQLAAFVPTTIYVREQVRGPHRWFPCSVGEYVSVTVRGATGCVRTQTPRRDGALTAALDAASFVRSSESDLIPVCRCDGLVVAVERTSLDRVEAGWLREQAEARAAQIPPRPPTGLRDIYANE